MPEKKRPAFTVKPFPSAVVCTNASSTDTVLSGASAMLAAPRHHGSMLAEIAELGFGEAEAARAGAELGVGRQRRSR